MNSNFSQFLVRRVVPMSVSGQEVLEPYVVAGLASNHPYLKARLSTTIVFEERSISKSRFFPKMGFNRSNLQADGGSTVGFPVGGLLNPASAPLHPLTRTKEFPVDLENLKERLQLNEFRETKTSVLQPILNSSPFRLMSLAFLASALRPSLSRTLTGAMISSTLHTWLTNN